MPMSLPSKEIIPRKLVFVALPAFEGEFRVGLGRVLKRKKDNMIEIAWCVLTFTFRAVIYALKD